MSNALCGYKLYVETEDDDVVCVYLWCVKDGDVLKERVVVFGAKGTIDRGVIHLWSDVLQGFYTYTDQSSTIVSVLRANWGYNLSCDERKQLLLSVQTAVVSLDTSPSYGSLEGFL